MLEVGAISKGIRALSVELEEEIQEVMAGASFTELLLFQGSTYIPVAQWWYDITPMPFYNECGSVQL